MITSTPGRGTFVRDQVMLTYHATRAEAADRPSDWHTDAYFFEAREQGRQPSQSFDMRIDAASLSVAERLRVEEGAPVVVRRMIRYLDGQPWSIQDSSYPMDIAQECGLLVPRDIPRGTVRVMADHGHVEVGHVDEITTRMPTPEEASTLELGSGVPVLEYVRTAYTKQRPVRLTKTVFAGDRNRLVYELGQLEALYEQDAP
jgi:GntR family transcriptional regulator